MRKGDKVRILPPRGTISKGDQRLWLVKDIDESGQSLTARLELRGFAEPESRTALAEDLVVVAEFRDVIYPGLVSTGKEERGRGKPFHSIINGENYHVLKALTYSHRGKVDAIYIDPPYNSGAKDWKYNNDYIEKEDVYRHSKWLAFMERRLLLAKELLNPNDSVLIVTIDEKEYLRLGLLIEQIFPGTIIQMVSSVIKPSGSTRSEFSRVDEYLFFVMIGSARPADALIDMMRGQEIVVSNGLTWQGLRRRGSDGWERRYSPGAFYPVFISTDELRIVEVGDAIPLGKDRREVVPPAGTFAIWPLDPLGREGRWQILPSRFREQLQEGTLVLSSADAKSGSGSILYLKKGDRARVIKGDVTVTSKDSLGRLKVEDATKWKRPQTQWNVESHDASAQGTALLTKLVGDRKFPYPKSLYAVEDALRFFVREKSQAIILDFFGGSGTTAHATMKLNREDGGSRQCILVTNNEVAAEEQQQLRKAGLRPGDPDWEQFGICDYITKPRIRAAITGKTPNGEPIKGDYKFTDEFPMAEGFEQNAEFFDLTYEMPVAVSHDRAFERIAPILWMRAGSQGKRIEMIPIEGWEIVDTYGLLHDLDHASAFCSAVQQSEALRVAYIVTDDDRRFQAVAQRLPATVEPVRLYESYLSNFSFASGE